MESFRKRVAYNHTYLELDIPRENLAFDVGPSDLPPEPDPEDLVRAVVQDPIGTPALARMVRAGQRVLVIADDNTRRTPASLILPVLLAELNQAGVPDRDIQVLISSGTHRHMTESELNAKFGPSVRSRVPVLFHRHKDAEALTSLGTTGRGTPIELNRLLFEADFRIAVGDIIPHYPAGWSGGAKAVLPGVAGEKTTSALHYLGCRHPHFSVVETEMRREMEEVARAAKLDFIVNTILNRQGKLANIVAGDMIAAHREGVQKSAEIYGVTVPEPVDLCVSSTSPVDLDLFQAAKGISAAERVTRPGGEIMLLSGCTEGISPAHPELADYMGRMSTGQLWELAESGRPADPLTCAGAILINTVRDSAGITLVTDGISPDLASQLGLGHIPPRDFQVEVRRRIEANPALRVGILHCSAELLPAVG